MKKIVLLLVFLVLFSLSVSANGFNVYWDPVAEETVINTEAGLALRIIKNENEFSPFWIYISEIDAANKTAKFSIGELPLLESIAYCETANNKTICNDSYEEYELEDSYEEYELEFSRRYTTVLPSGQSTTPNSKDFYGNQFKVKLIEVADAANCSAGPSCVEIRIKYADNGFPDLGLTFDEVSYNQSEKGYGWIDYSENQNIVYKLEGYPIWVFPQFEPENDIAIDVKLSFLPESADAAVIPKMDRKYVVDVGYKIFLMLPDHFFLLYAGLIEELPRESNVVDDSTQWIVDPNTGLAEPDSAYAASALPSILSWNAGSALSQVSSQSNSSEQYYFDTIENMTVLNNVSAGKAYRIIANQNEYSPYWIAIEDISQNEVVISYGFIPSFATIEGLKSFVQFDNCKNMEVSFGLMQKRICETNNFGGTYFKTVFVSLDSAAKTASIKINLIEESQLPEAVKDSSGKYVVSKMKKGLNGVHKLEGLPIYFYLDTMYGYQELVPETMLLPKPNDFSQSVQGFIFLHEKLGVVNSDITEIKDSYGIGTDEFSVSFSLNEGKLSALKEIKTQNNFLQLAPKPEEFNVKAYVDSIFTQPSLADKFDFSLKPSSGDSIKMNIASEGSTAVAYADSVPVGEYVLAVTDSTSGQIIDSTEVSVNGNTVLDLTDQIPVNEKIVDIFVQAPELVVNALNQGGIAPEIKDSSGEEPDYVGILGQTGKGLVNNWVNDIKTNLATATLRIYGTAEEYAGKLGISVPDSCTTNQKLIPLTQTAPDVFSVLIPDSVTIINPDVSSCPVPEEDFKLSIIIGKDNYALLEKNNWQGVYVYSLDSSHKDERWYINKAYLFSPDSLTKDRLIILLSKGTEYNFVVEESDNTRSFNYYKEAVRIPSSGQPITDSMTELDLTGYSFANTKSALISGPIAGKAQQAVSLASISVESGIIQLQIDLGNYPLTQAQKQELNQQIIDELKSSLSSSCKVTEPAKEQISCPEGSYQIADGTIFIPLAGTPGFLIIPDKKLIQVSKTAPATVKLTAQPAGNLTNLQVKSVNGLTCTPNNKNNFVCLENKVPHIVYLAKGTKQIEIELQDYSNEKMFFAVGEKGKVKQPSTTANNSSDYPSASVSNSIVEFDAFTAQFKNGKYFSIDSYSGQKIVLNNWDETSLEFYACQDKDADNKCDLYYVNGTEKHGASFIEPNYEAASITIKSESKKAVVKLNLNLPEPVLYLDEFIQESLNEIEGQLEGQGITCTPSGEGTLECDEGNVYLNNFSLETPQGNFNAAPQQGSGGTLIIEGREIEVTITLTPESQGQQTTTVRISDQPPSQDCIIAMDNAEKFEAEIEKYSEIFSMDPNLTRAIIQAESSFKANAIGKDSSGEKSSYGLMQIHESNLTAWTDIFGSGWSTTETWKDVNKNIQAGTRYFNSGNFLGSLEKWVNNLSCSQESLSTVLSGSGEVQATWKTALKIARYNCSQVSCDSIGCSTTRETYVPKVIAWYRVFAENYGKKAELGKDYCKPTKIVSTGVVPPIETPAACSTCNTIVECLACVDYKFVSGIAKTE